MSRASRRVITAFSCRVQSKSRSVCATHVRLFRDPLSVARGNTRISLSSELLPLSSSPPSSSSSSALSVFRVTGGIGMLARVAVLRIPDEKPSGSCTYPGCTCTRWDAQRGALRCFKHLSRRLHDFAVPTNLAIHPEYISRRERGHLSRGIYQRLRDSDCSSCLESAFFMRGFSEEARCPLRVLVCFHREYISLAERVIKRNNCHRS